MALDTLDDCAKALEGLSNNFGGIDNLAASLRQGSIPILSLGHFERHGLELARVVKRVRDIVQEEQRKETQVG